MKLTRNGIKNQELWEKAGIKLPGYDVETVSEKAKKEPKLAIFSVYLSEVLRTASWRKGRWIGGLPAWRRLIMMW